MTAAAEEGFRNTESLLINRTWVPFSCGMCVFMTKDRTDSAYLGGGVGDVTPPIPKGTGSISFQDTSTYNYNS